MDIIYCFKGPNPPKDGDVIYNLRAGLREIVRIDEAGNVSTKRDWGCPAKEKAK